MNAQKPYLIIQSREQRLKVIIIIICLFNRSLSSKNDLIILDYTIQNNATHTSDAAENFDYLLRRHFADFNFLLRATTSVTLGYRLPADNRYPKWSENTTLICSKLHLNSPSKYSFTNFDQLHKNFRKIVFVMLADWAPEATGISSERSPFFADLEPHDEPSSPSSVPSSQPVRSIAHDGGEP